MSQINNNIDPDSRDYDLKSIEPDERFTQTTKEFWITLGTYLVFMVLMIANLYQSTNTFLDFRSGFLMRSLF